MAAEIPKPIDLTEEEKKLESQIRYDLDPIRDRDEVIEACDLGRDLMCSLVDRDAIPGPRMAFFTEAEHNVGQRKSRLDVFRSNGADTLDDVFGNAHFFYGHLRYFLYGPQLPAETIEGFCRIVNDDVGTSAMVMDDLSAFARAQVRKHSLDRSDAPEQFYLLALECDQEPIARIVRDAAKSAKRG